VPTLPGRQAAKALQGLRPWKPQQAFCLGLESWNACQMPPGSGAAWTSARPGTRQKPPPTWQEERARASLSSPASQVIQCPLVLQRSNLSNGNTMRTSVDMSLAPKKKENPLLKHSHRTVAAWQDLLSCFRRHSVLGLGTSPRNEHKLVTKYCQRKTKKSNKTVVQMLETLQSSTDASCCFEISVLHYWQPEVFQDLELGSPKKF